MRSWIRGAWLVGLVAALACEAGEPPGRAAESRAADTAGVADSAAAVGDSIMARDTMP